ncbi:phage P22-like portal protein [Paraburkholderia silvatlantica]|uniref:Phage P22-like portal protein n=1 Tax=Paraburkholderia silvatlantica TaxID=321895 RepID=A0A2V4T730_9BURK|nr:portal protein [Paraburkholderia silvatlantica]PYE21339.1 phage P22-like portal protein [Paraburkholderia silvatlantica]
MAERSKTIVARAHERFRSCVEWEGPFRQRYKDDMRFLYADSDNGEQWPASVRAARQSAGQVMVTINKTHTHWLHVVNQAKENRAAISVSPTGSQASYDSAQIFEQIIKRIEYISDAETAYEKAIETAVGGGIGYWRIVTDYTDQDSFDQEIFIKQIADPLTVYLDPHIKTQDGSDAKFAFVFDEVSRREAEKRWPEYVGKSQSLGDMAENWMRKDSVRYAEYYERNESKEWLYAIPSGDDDIILARESSMPPGGSELLKMAYDQNIQVQRRRVEKYEVDWYLIVGDKVAERAKWAGKYIPIVRVVGEELIQEGKLDRKGIVRYLKDAQRAYNYNASAALEFGALQSKSPYLAPVEAIEGLENYWSTANTQNHAYLPYNHADDQGNPIPPPQRQQPPTGATVYVEGMQAAEHELMMASGQYESTFSEQGNEISGVSIEQRKQQGERVTFHYLDNLAKAIRYTGKQLIDLIPKIYDTKRVLRIMDEGGEEHQIKIDPQSKQALQQQEDQGEAQVAAIFNPAVGNYEVIARVGPNFETRRKEAFSAMTNMLTANESLAPVIGDLYMANADFPYADKLQERMRNWIKTMNPAILGEGPTPMEQQLQQQLQQAGQLIQTLDKELKDKTIQQQFEKQRLDMDALTHLSTRLEKERQETLDAFKAETDRLKALAPQMSEDALDPIVRKVVSEIMRAPDPDLNAPADADPAAIYASGIAAAVEAPPEPTPQ